MYLAQYLAQASVASRRNAIELIKSGFVAVNNATVKDPTYKIMPKDIVKYRGTIIHLVKKLYIVLNKPAGFVTTLADEHNRQTVIDIIRPSIKDRVFPIGRLDYDTSGLLVLTNDGDFAQLLAHPRYKIQKTYHVTLTDPITADDLMKLKNGVTLSDGLIAPDKLFCPQGKTKRHVIIELHSGRNRIIRRLFAHLGYGITKLERIRYANLTLKGLPSGAWRTLTAFEVEGLKTLCPQVKKA